MSIGEFSYGIDTRKESYVILWFSEMQGCSW
jgi:hypothetical protein